MRAPDVEPVRAAVQVPWHPLARSVETTTDTEVVPVSHLRALLDIPAELDVVRVYERVVTASCQLFSAPVALLGVVGRQGQVTRLLTRGIDLPGTPTRRTGADAAGAHSGDSVCTWEHGSEPAAETCEALRRHFGMVCPLSAMLESAAVTRLPHSPGALEEESPPSQGVRTPRPALAVPILVDEEPYAVLLVTRAHAFTDADLAVAETLSSTAATAVANALLYERAQRREAWLQASLEIEQQLLAGSDHQEVMDLIADRACRAAGADAAAIVLPVDGQKFVIEAVAGAEFRDAVGRRIGRDGTLSELVMTTGRSEIVDNATADSRLRLPAGVPQLGSGIVAPLTASGRPLGALLIGSVPEGRVFTDVDVQLVSTFAGHAALALELARAQEDQARLAVYEDRERIALDLHDLVIQRLFASGLALQTMRRYVPSMEALDRLEEISSDLDGTIMDIRATIFGLQRTPSTPQSLRGQITDVVEAARQSLGFSPRVRFSGPLDRLVPHEVREHVVAVIREGLSNVWRHAGASAVTVAVAATGEELCVEVVDNGNGLSDTTRRSGLDNLRARAERFNGSFEVGSRHGKGTRLRWRVPMSSTAA